MHCSSEDVIIEGLSFVLHQSRRSLDIDLSFPQLGGNSLSAISLSSFCKRRDVALSASDILRSSSIRELMRSTPFFEPLCKTQSPEEHRNKIQRLSCATISTSQKELEDLSLFSIGNAAQTVEDGCLNGHIAAACQTKISLDIEAGASDTQNLMIHDSTKYSGTSIIRYCEKYNSIDIPAVKAAWHRLYMQEAVLRTSYSADLEPRKCVFDWSEHVTDNSDEFKAWLHDPWDASGIQSSWKVITLSSSEVQPRCDTTSVVIWIIHHALIDGYSAKLLLTKLRELTAGRFVSAGPSYADVLKAIPTILQTKNPPGASFWSQHEELYRTAAIDIQLPPPVNHRKDLGVREYHIPLGLNTQMIRDVAQACGVTPAALLYSAWSIVLSHLVDSDTVAFGVAILGRDLPLMGIEDVVGPLMKTRMLAIAIYEGKTVREFASDVFQHITSHSEYHLTMPESLLERGFQSAFFTEVDLEPPALEFSIDPVEKPTWTHESAIPMTVIANAETTTFQYRKSCFYGTSVEQVSRLFEHVVQSFGRLDMSLRLLKRSLITPEELLALNNYENFFSISTKPIYIRDDLVTLFERAVAENPHLPAVQVGDRVVIYSELDYQIGVVAHALKAFLTSNQEIVCLNADRSLNWIIGIFAILKAGAVYCPLDPNLPAETRALTVKNSSANILLCGSHTTSYQETHFAKVLGIEAVLTTAASLERSVYPRRAIPNPSAAAYVCHTSGSTGVPKGVICSHEGLVAFQSDLEVRLFAQPGRRISQIMSPAFDGSIHEIFSALCYGATLLLSEGPDVLNTLHSAHSALMTPSVAEVLDPSDYPQLTHVYLVGEPVKQSLNDRWARCKATYNMYGPTEGTCGATIGRLRPSKEVTIGRPHPTTRLYILDSKARRVPFGIIGEIYLAGVQVSRGYLNMPKETAARFTPDPFYPESDEYMYKTGDRAYWTSEGEIVWLGRVDRQIKLRGFRLDLDDLEIRAAGAHEEIKSVAMAVHRDYIVAAVKPSTLDRKSITMSFARVLPAYAQPRHVILTDEFPMTNAGKLDYKQIATLSHESAQVVRRTCLTELEAIISKLWHEILGLGSSEQITSESNFLHLGGNSMLQMTLLTRLSCVLGTQVPLRLLIESHSLGELATRLENLPSKSMKQSPFMDLLSINGRISFREQEWLTKYNLQPKIDTRSFNVSSLFRFGPNSLDLSQFELAWNATLRRYPVLKSRYLTLQGQGTEACRQCTEKHLEVKRVGEIDVEVEVNRQFDLKQGPPIRVLLSDSELLVVASHIIADLSTFNIVFRDVENLYQGRCLAPVRYFYENQCDQGPSHAIAECDFWRQYLGAPSGHNSRSPVPIRRRRGFNGASRLYQLSRDLSEDIINSTLRSYGLSHQQLALAALGIVLNAEKEETDIILGTPFMNRSTCAEMETVGLFLQPLPVRLKYASTTNETDSCKGYLSEVRHSATAALAHSIPWHELLEHLNIQPEYPDNPLFDVMVTFHTPDMIANLSLPQLVPCFSWSQGSKFLLMTEFTVIGQGVMLRMEYDTDHYSIEAIDTLAAGIAAALLMLLSGAPISEIKKIVQSQVSKSNLAELRNDLFGKPMV
ncbi:hypothetical protein F5Y16DRAFT_50509 [Xylariaceae sp. FL0255]|nr:hypothetical protein F5Y16DRAFT_50509 [Xylariaceae sp. FL0255]